MSSAQGAGSGALLKALHPGWSPAEIRSALASSSDNEGILKEDGDTPADPFDMGSGRLDLDKAGRVGLVMDETHANFVAANPDTGGDPKTLNLPAMVDQNCVETCSWTRTVRHVADAVATYAAEVVSPPGMGVTVDPPAFTLAPGATQVLEISVDVSGLPTGSWTFRIRGVRPAQPSVQFPPTAECSPASDSRRRALYGRLSNHQRRLFSGFFGY